MFVTALFVGREMGRGVSSELARSWLGDVYEIVMTLSANRII